MPLPTLVTKTLMSVEPAKTGVKLAPARAATSAPASKGVARVYNDGFGRRQRSPEPSDSTQAALKDRAAKDVPDNTCVVTMHSCPSHARVELVRAQI